MRPPDSWRGLALLAGAAALAAAVGGFAFAWSGLYDVAASRGHWWITNRMLHFAMESSIEHHAGAIAVPALDEPMLLHLGLNHYQAGCAPCHGAPGQPRNPIPLQAVPEPPFLPALLPKWKPAELFWIVKHGVKYTSMPAWPAQERDDEVWAVVAALLRMADLAPEEYRRLLAGDTVADPERVAEDARLIAAAGPVGEDLVACARCHGLDGAGGGAGAFPRLTGLGEAYVYGMLRRYASGSRASGVMQPIAAALFDDEMRILARHYAGLPARGAPPATRAEHARRREAGRAVAAAGLPAAGVPACDPCHAADRRPRHPLFPPLAGQHERYLARQLRVWRLGIHRDTPEARIMTVAARGLDDAAIDAVAHYYGTLPPPSAAADDEAGVPASGGSTDG
jgi:cytochrome c553